MKTTVIDKYIMLYNSKDYIVLPSTPLLRGLDLDLYDETHA